METIFVREIQLKYKGARKAFFGISGPENAATFIVKILPDNVREHFVALYLDIKHKVIAYSVVATGTASSCPVHAREIFQPAIMCGAQAVLIAHNHPSDDTTPSIEDRTVTKRLKEAGDLLSIPVLDHLIVSNSGFFSFHEREGL